MPVLGATTSAFGASASLLVLTVAVVSASVAGAGSEVTAGGCVEGRASLRST